MSRAELPPPATARSARSDRTDKWRQKPEILAAPPPKKTKFSSTVRIWARFKQRLSSGSAPSMLDATIESDATSLPHRSILGGTARNAEKKGKRDEDDNDDTEVDEIVVENSFEIGAEKASVTQPSEMGTAGNGEKTATGRGGTDGDHDSMATGRSLWDTNYLLVLLRWRIYPALHYFFYTQFTSPEMERAYSREIWYASKMLALLASCFLVLNWVLACIFVPRPFVLFDTIWILGIAPALTLPIPVMVLLRFPRRWPTIYQTFLTCAVWGWPLYQLLSLRLCGFYRTDGYFDCAGKDFIGILYYATAMPAIGLFALGQHRLPAALLAAIFVVLTGALVVPDKSSWTRTVLNLIAFHSFLLYIHYMREQGERYLYTLRAQVKEAFLKIQKAQVSERKAAESKRRLTSYIFHEVRVPLNTAMLAVQNMEAQQTIGRSEDIEFAALQGSLNVMSKVLNDVLDLNRMDAGRFESISRPFNLHLTIRSLLIPLGLAADARGLELTSSLDKNIDLVARRAMYIAEGDDEATIARKLEEDPDQEGIVVGDENRLRQIVTNLTSNAAKFTQRGGKISVKTQLIYPTGPIHPPKDASADPVDPSALSRSRLAQHNSEGGTVLNPIDRVVIRIEVSDTGLGIRARDVHDHRLFSPYVQTEIGKNQGGKGSGLGLALVRHIVKLSGGRLGVKSKIGQGSTFWLELSMAVGAKAKASGSVSSEKPDTVHFRSRPTKIRADDVKHEPRHRTDEPRLKVERTDDVKHRMDEHKHLRVHDKTDSPTTKSSSLGALPPAGVIHQHVMDQHGTVDMKAGSSDIMTSDLKSSDMDLKSALARRAPPPGFSHHGHPSPSTSTDRSESIVATPSTQSTTDPTVPDIAIHQPDSGTDSLADSAKTLGDSSSTVRHVQAAYFESPSASPARPSPAASLLPSSSTSGRASPARSSPGSAGPPFDLSVLVVDDDHLTRTLMRRLLTRLGCRVETAENGQLALDMIMGPQTATPGESEDSTRSGSLQPASTSDPGTGSPPGNNNFALIFLDNQMPVMSGLETVARLRQAGRNDFVVGVTGNALLSDQNEYLDAGVDHVLTKPVQERSLRTMLTMAQERLENAPPSTERPQ